jgi:hypothetical protein
MAYSIHATKKLLDRVKRPVADPISEPSTMLGNWCANALFLKPQFAVLVSERTLLPVFMPLAPASGLAERFAEQLGRVLDAIGVPIDFVAQELLAMEHASFAKTANGSVVGSMNDFAYLAEFQRRPARLRIRRRCRHRWPKHHVRRCITVTRARTVRCERLPLTGRPDSGSLVRRGR